MADPTDSYPAAATKGGQESTSEGKQALEAALDQHGAPLAAALARTDDVDALLETAILIVASASDEEVEYVTDSTVNLLKAADGLSTPEAAALAEDLGQSSDDLASALDTLLSLQRSGQLDELVDLATTFSDSLSAADRDRLAGLLETDGDELVEALDVVLELQRTGKLDDLVSLAETLSTLDVDDETVRGINTVLAAVGEADQDAEPVGFVGFVRGLRSRDARAGLGYLLALLKALGRRVRP